MRYWITLALIFCWPSLADYGPYRATYISAYDGDTATLLVVLGPGLYRQTRVRILTIDTPEIKGKCEAERTLAIKARDYVRQRLAEADITLTVTHPDSFGRWLAVVYVDGEPLADELIHRGLARRWTGRREGWC